MTFGSLGHLFITLSFFTACSGIYGGLRWASCKEDGERHFWSRFLIGTAIVHALTLFSTLWLLWYLLFTHRFEYHYVWAHSARGLPAYYLVAALWEGQEGSFLLWLCWHAILMPFLVFLHKNRWQRPFTFVFLVQAILSSMLLGIYIHAALIPLWVLFGVLSYEWFSTRRIQSTGILLWSIGIAVLFLLGKNGFLNPVRSLGYAILLVGFVVGGYLLYNQRWNFQQGVYFLIGLVLFAIAGFSEGTTFKIGSSPFLLLREAMPELPIFQQQPDFVPSDGNGLNPLLQNYWMVIHPPILFLGYAVTSFPFALLLTSLLENHYRHIVRILMPWMSLTVLFLGTGIVLGGYWAYETLSFGGYWNWDPVENASFVPWLFAVGGIHGLLAYQKRKTNLHLTLLLVLFTFLFVLYSTFLTRSGILGDTSVHSFTDLGLSGQLVFLLLCLLAIAFYLFLYRWKSLPKDPEVGLKITDATLWLTLALFLFLFLGLEIITVTSLPVFNVLFNTHFAPPSSIQKFYYHWTAPFGILIPTFSTLGIFLYWFRFAFSRLLRTLLPALLLSGLFTLLFSYYFMSRGISFAYDMPAEAIVQLPFGSNLLQLIHNSLDDLLLFCSFYNVFGTIILLWHFVKKYKFKLLLLGGSLSHFGFSLILIGAVFSSGYDRVVTETANGSELGNLFSEQERKAYLLLPKGEPRYTSFYRFTYLGKKHPSFPILQNTIQAIPLANGTIRVEFQDQEKERYFFFLPEAMFRSILQKSTLSEEADRVTLSRFIEQNYPFLGIKRWSNRELYQIRLESLVDSEAVFLLTPQAEIHERMGLIAHPDRKMFWDKDVYLHIASIPREDGVGEFHQERFALDVGESHVFFDSMKVLLEQLVQVTDDPRYADYDLIAKAKLRVYWNGIQFRAEPLLLIKRDQAISEPFLIPPIQTQFQFLGVDTELKKVVFQRTQLIAPPDYVIIKAIEKPFINLLWLGTFFLTLGVTLSVINRFRVIAHAQPTGKE